MLMYKETGGFHNFAAHEVEAAMKDGWVDGAEIRRAELARKSKPVAAVKPVAVVVKPIESVAKPVETATIVENAAPRRGRPRKAEIAIDTDEV